ncbi:hypothetical protein WJX81_006453 [Elliptochloris bilobata]|uniref:Uncharacterized protein n=1 Tax=Elliptochloris bilobata TaxID=381761 RepID=A0AAW1RRP4_9CHLO
MQAYALLFRRQRSQNLAHADLHICYTNRASAWLALDLWPEALADAEAARKLAAAALRTSRGAGAAPSLVRALGRKGLALSGMGRHREAALALEEGLRLDAFDWPLKQALEAATQGIVRDLVEGRGRETRALPAPEPTRRITAHPHSAPLHKIRTDDMLPLQLLTPTQARLFTT